MGPLRPLARRLECVPAEGPALLIGNHNAAWSMPYTWPTALAAGALVLDYPGGDSVVVPARRERIARWLGLL